jgi:hypothetical protein
MSLSIPIVSQFDGKGIQKAIKGFQQLETKGQKAAYVLKKAGQAAALGFAAVGVAALTAGKFMLDFAKIARADQLAQVQLAGTLKATTKATDVQIAAVEEYIDVTQRATGVADDDLRPAFARLVRSTRDTQKAQKLLNLALDISGRTGKPLETVVNALGKAYDGSNTALGKLGLGYDQAELKVKSFKTIQDELTKEYAGGANDKAKTFEGTMQRLAITFGELKESLGTYILPFLLEMAESAIKVADAFGKGGMQGAVRQLKEELKYFLYDANGELNETGRTLKTIISAFNLAVGNPISALVGGAANFAATGNTTYTVPTIDSLAERIDPVLRDQSRRGVTSRQGLGMSNYIRNNPGSVVTVNVGPTANLADVGKEIKKAIAAADRQDGGYGSRSGNR